MTLRPLIALLILSTLTGCTQIIGATTDKPLEDDPGSRSIGSYIDDEIIETKVVVNIRKTYPELEGAHLAATSHNGIVLLTGQVPRAELKTAAAEVAAKVKKVRKIHNELSVGQDADMLARSNDSWLSTKVKGRLALEPQLDAAKIKVVTEKGVVYLMGLTSKAQSDLAAKIASETRGVQKVVRVFEYY